MIKSSLVAGAGGISRATNVHDASSSGIRSGGQQLAATTRLRARLPSAGQIFKSWRAHDITLRPFGDGWWAFNPSIHRDPSGVVRCVYRIANYTLPGGIPRLSGTAKAGRCETRNVLAILDPDTLHPVSAAEVRELDDLVRVPTCASVGYEDVRLFWTRSGELGGIATALQFNAAHPGRPEMVTFQIGDDGDGAPAFFDTRPLRGPWSCRPQKNWSPFDGGEAPRFLYSIERGVLMTEHGVEDGSPEPLPPPPPRDVVTRRSSVEVKVVPRNVHRDVLPRGAPGAQAARVGSDGLRGGGQLIPIARDRWLSIAHEMTLEGTTRKKLYWHTFYVVDERGRVTNRSAPFKLSGDHGIEFAAGIMLDGDGGVAVSYGTDDHESWVGRVELDELIDALAPVDDAGEDEATP